MAGKCSLQEVVSHLALGSQSPDLNLDCPPTDLHQVLCVFIQQRQVSHLPVYVSCSGSSLYSQVMGRNTEMVTCVICFLWLVVTLRHRVLYNSTVLSPSEPTHLLSTCVKLLHQVL